MAAVLRMLGEDGGDVLDAGMGPGRTCQELDRRGWRVSGLDTSAEMVSIARSRLPHARDRLLQAPVEHIPFDDHSFDAVVACGVLVEYSSDPDGSLREIARVLRPGGRAVISAPNASSLYGRWRVRVYNPTARRLRAHLGLRAPAPYARQGLPTGAVLSMVAAASLVPESQRYASYLVLPSPTDMIFEELAVRLSRRLQDSGPRLGRLFATQLVIAARKPRGDDPADDQASPPTFRRKGLDSRLGESKPGESDETDLLAVGAAVAKDGVEGFPGPVAERASGNQDARKRVDRVRAV